jgi:hypothetical protein
MPAWLGYLLAFGALIVLAPLLGWLGHRHGRSIKGGIALASIMLGFGVPLDPPAKHLIEAKQGRVKAGDETGEPPDPDVTRPTPSDG